MQNPGTAGFGFFCKVRFHFFNRRFFRKRNLFLIASHNIAMIRDFERQIIDIAFVYNSYYFVNARFAL